MTLTPTEAQQERRRLADETLQQQVRRLRDAATAAGNADRPTGGIDVRPTSTYEAITRQMVESLADDLQEIKSRLNNLFFMIAGAILIDVIARVIGT